MHVGPLPGTRIEAEGIKKALGLADDRVLLGARATEAAIKAVHGPRILHVATHGFFLPDQERFAPDAKITPLDLRRLGNPLVRSGLALAGFNARGGADGADDGVLTALEVTGLDLTGTELVVLSACETGLGRVDHGEGVYGLKRALVLAGARTQAVTLWKVSDDATQALMNAYYARLLKGEDRIEAMRAVQLDMLGGRVSRTEVAATTAGKQRDVLAFEELGSERGHNWKHPFYWASFTVSGAEGPIEMASADPPR
jgi:CHAT domain-containing protein